jgi:hypothetical protein
MPPSDAFYNLPLTQARVVLRQTPNQRLAQTYHISKSTLRTIRHRLGVPAYPRGRPNMTGCIQARILALLADRDMYTSTRLLGHLPDVQLCCVQQALRYLWQHGRVERIGRKRPYIYMLAGEDAYGLE